MARDSFDNAGSYLKIEELLGKLVLFTPTSYIEEIGTSFGIKDAVLTDLVVLDEDGQPEHNDVMVFQGKLIAELKRRIKTTKSIERDAESGVVSNFETTTVRRVLGVIGRGEAQKGQSAPFVLTPASDKQIEMARVYDAANPGPEPVKKMVGQYIDLGPGQVAAPAAAPATATAPAAVAAPTTTSPDEDPFAV